MYYTFQKLLLSSMAIAQIGLTTIVQEPKPVFASPKIQNKQSFGSRGFILPSRNIYCLLEEKSLRCEIQSMLRPLPREPYPGYCQLDWGHGFRLPSRGNPSVLCISDTIFNNYPVLNYGRTWRNGGFTCTSRTSGLTCTNSGGRGFFLSRKKWRTF